MKRAQKLKKKKNRIPSARPRNTVVHGHRVSTFFIIPELISLAEIKKKNNYSKNLRRVICIVIKTRNNNEKSTCGRSYRAVRIRNTARRYGCI